jgi:cyclic pyranopterin monophosphate synthase
MPPLEDQPTPPESLSGTSTHLNAKGEVIMINVGEKPVTHRSATAVGRVHLAEATLGRLADGNTPKGDVLATARIAGIQAAKRTPELIPLCHGIALTAVEVRIEADHAQGCLQVEATARAQDRTGVEMEALTAVSVAALTLYDMLKGVDQTMHIEGIRLVEKTGGKSDRLREPR